MVVVSTVYVVGVGLMLNGLVVGVAMVQTVYMFVVGVKLNGHVVGMGVGMLAVQ